MSARVETTSAGRSVATALAAGSLFAIGLALAGMGDSATVLRAFRFDASFDPRLYAMFVGALLVHAPVAAWTRRGATPPPGKLDARLVVGSIVFGVGWGLGGVCPGPAFLIALTGTPHAAVFVAGMIGGLSIYHHGFETVGNANVKEGESSWH